MAAESLRRRCETLLSRRSVPALQLREPGPSQAQIELAIDAALRAPDHGALQAVALRADSRRGARAPVGAVRAPHAQRDAGHPPGKIDKARRMPLAAPLVIAVGGRVLAHHKVPEIEQLLAAGAGVMNLLNAFHAQGYRRDLAHRRQCLRSGDGAGTAIRAGRTLPGIRVRRLIAEPRCAAATIGPRQRRARVGRLRVPATATRRP